ncbi:hypothetical protein JCM8115_001121 [Rhodotorula mucilaginosa]
MPSSSSRIPRTRTTTRARSALQADDDTDENLPPASRPPSRAGKAALAAPPPPPASPSRRLRVAFAPLHAATGQSNTNPADNQMPSPPNSSSQSSPPRKATRSAATTDKGLVVKKPASKLPRARSAAAAVGEPSSSNSLAVPTSSSGTSAAASTTRRRVSRSPIIAIPPGPSHAPHVLAARRRASVSPLPATASLPPAESSSSASSKPKRKSRAAGSTTRPKPRPSELLPVPLGSPPPPAGGGGGEDDADYDELLLLPPEMTRGRGEGKVRPPHHHAQNPGYYQGVHAPISRARRSTSRQLGAGDTTRFLSCQTSSTGAATAAEEGNEDQSIKSEHSLELVTAPPQQQQVDVSFFSLTAPSSDPAAAVVDGDDAAGEMRADSRTGDDHDGAGLLPDGGDDPYENDMGGFDGHDDFALSFEPEPEPELAAAPSDRPFATQSVEASHDAHETQFDEQPVPALVPGAAVSAHEEMDGVVVVVESEEKDEIPQPMATTTTATMMMEQPSLQFADLEEPSSGSEMGEGDDDAELEVEAVEEEVPLANEAEEEEEEAAAAGSAAQLLFVEEEGEEELKLTEEAIAEETADEHVASRSEEADQASLESHDDEDDEDGNASQDEGQEAAMNESMSSSFEFPSHSARQSRPSYPPLSPNRTGEFDEVPVRMASSSPEPEEDEKEVEVEVEPVVQVQVATEPVEADEPDVFAASNATARTTSPAASSTTNAPRLKEPELEEAKPVVASTSHATFPLHGTPSSVLPALLRPSTFFPSTRSPSPATFPPPRPLPSPASRPTLQFASPRLPRDRYPTASSAFGGTSPAPASLIFAPESSPAKSWTRGPAFFRSSSFSPPAHAALPKTATLFERHPGGAKARMMARGEGGSMMEQSREYQQWAGLETSSPAPPEEEGDLSQQQQREGDEAGSERDSDESEEEDEVILVGQEAQALERAKSRSLSPASATPATTAVEMRPEAAPKPADAPGQDSTAAASSSEEGGYASAARSLSGDVRMASPSPRHSDSSDRSDPESIQRTPRDVGATAIGDVDCRMASPSPARSEHVRSQGGSPLRARIGEFVEGSRSRIQGMLFGSPQSKRPSSQSEASSASDMVKASAQQEAAAAEDAEQPFANSNCSTTSFSSHTSRRSSRRRSRPSHPTLPVIEISSTDAHAAARAAAILKVYHKYVEQGVEAVDLERLVAAEQAGAAFDASIAERSRRSSAIHNDDDDEAEEEEELRTLLHDAEEEVRELVPRQSSTPAEAILSGLNTIPPPRQAISAASVTESLPPWTSREWRRLEQALVEVGRRQLRATSAVSAASTSISMTSEAIASASVTGEDVEPDEVIETFLRKWSIPQSNLRDEWSWDKLVIRVEALQARRAKDAQSKRASSVRSQHAHQSTQTQTGSSRDHQQEAEDEEDGAIVDDESLVKLEASEEADEDALAHAEEGSNNASSSDDEEGDAEADETFFAPSRGGQYRRRRRSSIEPVHQPTALANPALRHLYEATPAPEKPRLKGLVRPLPPASESSDDEEEQSPGTLSGSGTDERSQHTPELREVVSEGGGKSSPSSAQRLLSYLGSFVRRSPGASPSSSTRAAPRSSGSSSPEASSSTSSEEPEMKQVEQRSFSLGVHTAKPLPPISDRKILPLPPSHVPVASTSKAGVAADTSLDHSALAADTTTASSSFVPFAYRRRRRSSDSGTGERSLVWDVVNAIEEAESSREEEEARIVELLQNNSSSSGGVKRRAASGDLRVATSTAADSRAQDKGKGKARGFVEVERELERAFVPTGTRALDRRVSGEKRATRR